MRQGGQGSKDQASISKALREGTESGPRWQGVEINMFAFGWASFANLMAALKGKLGKVPSRITHRPALRKRAGILRRAGILPGVESAFAQSLRPRLFPATETVSG